ncbi:MAG: EAL domain-containing protein, partial [Sulfuricurvum sp.]
SFQFSDTFLASSSIVSQTRFSFSKTENDSFGGSDDAALVETILSIASIFNLDVIAEGVEETEQLEFLDRHQCGYFQGYLCSKPMQIGSFEELLNQDVQRCQSHL